MKGSNQSPLAAASLVKSVKKHKGGAQNRAFNTCVSPLKLHSERKPARRSSTRSCASGSSPLEGSNAAFEYRIGKRTHGTTPHKKLKPPIPV